MKLGYYSWALLLAATFSSCSGSDITEEEENPIHYITPTLQTSSESLNTSRTQINGTTGEVSWTADDQLLVFVHESGKQPTSAAEWQKCRHKFVNTATGDANNQFAEDKSSTQPLKLDPAKSYDWYVMSPYTESVQSPVNHGSFAITDQTQDENAPTRHLAKTSIMTNTKTNVKAQQNMSITLKHLATLMTFKVHNKLSTNMTLSYLEFETASAAPAPVAGNFSVNFKNGLSPIATSNKMRLDLINAKSIAPNGSCMVYAMMQPFNLAANDQFKILVVTDQSSALQTATMRGNISFKAGTINRANIQVTPLSTQTDINPWESQGETDDTIIIE